MVTATLMLALLVGGDPKDYEKFEFVGTLVGHRGRVLCVDLDPEGAHAISGSDAGEVFVWDLARPDQPQILRRKGAAILSVALENSGLSAVAVDADGAFIRWGLPEGRVEMETRLGGVEAARASPDAVWVTQAAGAPGAGGAGWTHVQAPFDAPNRAAARTSSVAIAIGYDAKGQRAAVAGYVAAANLFTVTLFDGAGGIVDEAFIERVPLSAAAGSSMWAFSDLEGGVELHDGKGAAKRWTGGEAARSMLFSPEEAVLAVGGAEGAIEFRDGPRVVSRWAGHEKGVNDLSFREDGRLLASASDDTTVKLWAPRDRKSDGERVRVLVMGDKGREFLFPTAGRSVFDHANGIKTGMTSSSPGYPASDESG